MPPFSPRTAPLHCHPAAPCAAVTSLTVGWAHDARAQAIRFSYALAGALDDLLIPAPAPRPSAADGLWRHTCFEAFVGAGDEGAYLEFNFSPAGHWAAYAFSAERMRDAGREVLAPRAVCRRRDAGTLRLDAWVPTATLAPVPGAWRLGLAAVIETLDGQLSHWALAHPRPQADFHHRAGWTARLPSFF